MFPQSKTVKLFLSLLLILAFCIFAACSTDSPEKQEEAPAVETIQAERESPADTAEQEEPAPTQESPDVPGEMKEGPFGRVPKDVYVIASYAEISFWSSFADMYARSPIVLLGHFEREVDLWNLEQDSSKPTEKHYTDTRIYRFRTQEVLKGTDIPEGLSVNFSYSHKSKGTLTNRIVNELGQVIQEATEEYPYKITVIRDYFIEPPLKQTILLFLRLSEYNNSYYAAGHPAMIALPADGRPELLSRMLPTEENPTAEPQPQIFQIEGGKTIYYYDSGLNPERVRNYLEGMELDDLLDEMEIQDKAQRERIHSIVRSNAEDE
ncbi:MAG: hypothetical protein IJP07_04605 [Firmicutes bacterium]|nr:hypothetical protein [Bacillota bacterium]